MFDFITIYHIAEDFFVTLTKVSRWMLTPKTIFMPISDVFDGTLSSLQSVTVTATPVYFLLGTGLVMVLTLRVVSWIIPN